MKLSHLLYKVDNLNDSVRFFRDKGFNVEYGSKNKPKNALIYFSKGPYIELIQNALSFRHENLQLPSKCFLCYACLALSNFIILVSLGNKGRYLCHCFKTNELFSVAALQ